MMSIKNNNKKRTSLLTSNKNINNSKGKKSNSNWRFKRVALTVMTLALTTSMLMPKPTLDTSAANISDNYELMYNDNYSTLKLTYELDENGNAIITGGYNQMVNDNILTSGDELFTVIIPEKIDNHYVTGIKASAFKGRADINIILMQDGIEFIGDEAFADCENVEYLQLANSIKSIGYRSFANLNIEQLYINSKNLSYIGEYAFENNKSMRTLYITPEDREDSIDISSIGIFSNCDLLEDIVLPTQINEIGAMVFYNCNSLKRIRYAGTADEFSLIHINSGNDALRNSIIYCEFGKEGKKVETGFNPDHDMFSFDNRKAVGLYAEYNLNDGYDIKFYDKLNNSEGELARDYLIGAQSDGYCYGITILASLIYRGIVNPSELTPGARWASEINPYNNTCRNVLTYYQALQINDPVFIGNRKSNFTNTHLLNDIINEISNGEVIPLEIRMDQSVKITYTSGEVEEQQGGGAHATLAYGVEYNEYILDNVKYNGKINIYDSNAPKDEQYDIYFNLETGDYTIPAYEYNKEYIIDESYIPSRQYLYLLDAKVNEQSTISITGCITDSTLQDYKGLYEHLVKYSKDIDTGDTNTLGDVNLDGDISVLDIVYLQKYLLASQTYTIENYIASDMNGDARVDIFDLALLKRKLLEESEY